MFQRSVLTLILALHLIDDLNNPCHYSTDKDLASVGPGLPEPYPLALTGLRRFTLVVRRHPSFGCIVALRSSRRLLSQGASPPAKGAEGCIKPRYQIIASHELQPCTRAHEDAARLPISTLIAYKRFGVLVCHIQSATFLLRSGIR